MPSALNTEWENAKKDFTKITGKSKPKPNGLLDKAFNHTGVSTALKKCDKLVDAIDGEVRDMNKKAKLIAAGEKYIPTVAKAAKSYMSTLDRAIKDEVSDKGEKTTYSKGLKFLKNELDALESRYEQIIDRNKIALEQDSSGMEKAIKMVHKALKSCIANAAAGVKKVKADPTVDRYNEVFNQSDNIARKVQVQLITAATGQKRGLIPSDGMRVDPRFIADKLTPWQAQGRPDTHAQPDWDKDRILSQVGEFTKLLKLANAFLDDLSAQLK